jgi:hypothetical protein
MTNKKQMYFWSRIVPSFGMIMDDEREGIWKEAVLPCLKLPRQFIWDRNNYKANKRPYFSSFNVEIFKSISILLIRYTEVGILIAVSDMLEADRQTHTHIC